MTFSKFRASRDNTFEVFSETHHVPLLSGDGSLAVDRRCSQEVFIGISEPIARVLLIPGFSSNRHVFDMGGGIGKNGPCFIEYIAKHGYDVFSMDLRGSRQSTALGAPLPSCMREYVVEDIHSVVTFILSHIHEKEKLYLVGHSVGAALACSYASAYPDNVKGIVHLAGLYHYSIPIIGQLISLYREHCPKIIRKPIHWMTHYCIESVKALYSPASSICRFTDNHSYGLLTSTFGYILKTPIPLRSVLDIFLKNINYFPELGHSFLNSMYPSPWKPNSVEDLIGFLDQGIESPTIGILASIFAKAWYDDIYNNGMPMLPEENTQMFLDMYFSNDDVTFSKTKPFSKQDNKVFYPWYNELGPSLEIFKSCQHSIFFAYANHDEIIKPKSTIRGFLDKLHMAKESVIYGALHIRDRKDSGIEECDLKIPLQNINEDKLKKAHSDSRLCMKPEEHASMQFKKYVNGYYLPHELSFGHADVLTGKHAEVLWELIVEWMHSDSRRRQNSN